MPPLSNNTDRLLVQYAAEIDERQAFIDGIVEGAQNDARDLSPQEMELVTRSRERMQTVNELIEPLREARRIAIDSAARVAEIAQMVGGNGGGEPTAVEYRSAGHYIIDRWRAGIGHDQSRARLEVYHRAAAHQTTGDNPGLLPESIIGPVVSFVDDSRPLVNVLGPRQLPGGSWSRPTVTQHTRVGPQSAEKTELVSQKMVINKVPVSPMTYGGYVNVSRQDIDWTMPGVMDIVVNDLAAQYAIETENATADDMVAASTAGPTIPTGTPDAADIAAAWWAAAGAVYAATKGAGRLVSVAGPDMLQVLGPIFPPVNPQNAQSAGFQASGFGTGPTGSIAGIPLYVSAGMAANTALVFSTAAYEVYEDRLGSLQVVEPSVLGVQVAYAGYFAHVTIQPEGIVKIAKTP